MFCESAIKIITHLLSAWTCNRDVRGVLQGADRDGMPRVGTIRFGQLGGEETQTTGHFVDTSDFTNEAALEGIHFGIELTSGLVSVPE
jgi:hypothetical protein